jgi:signal transduction histidine kinase
VSVDPVRLEQILRNLIDNAAKYGTPGAAICIDVEPHAAGVGIRISDCGPGIEPTELPHVFDRFYRSSRAANIGTPGFGLGLFITKGLVKAHGGQIAVDSVLGHGSVFRIALPPAR